MGAASPIKYDYVILDEDDGAESVDYGNKPYHTYEEAELACLRKLIDVVKTKQHGV